MSSITCFRTLSRDLDEELLSNAIQSLVLKPKAYMDIVCDPQDLEIRWIGDFPQLWWKTADGFELFIFFLNHFHFQEKFESWLLKHRPGLIPSYRDELDCSSYSEDPLSIPVNGMMGRADRESHNAWYVLFALDSSNHHLVLKPESFSPKFFNLETIPEEYYLTETFTLESPEHTSVSVRLYPEFLAKLKEKDQQIADLKLQLSALK